LLHTHKLMIFEMSTNEFFDSFSKKASGNQISTINIKSKCTNDDFELKGRPCELSAFSHVPTSRKSEVSDRNVFNYKKANESHRSNFDQLFGINYDFDKKIHRCDRKHARLRGLSVWDEEIIKNYPTKSSSEYGRRIVNISDKDSENKISNTSINYADPLDPQDRKHVRIMTVKSSFYNRNGLNDLTQANDILFY
jgi:hypothetical protein